MLRPSSVLAFAALAAALFACGAASTPRIRVARDLGCSADDTTVERIEVGPRPGQRLERWRVTGCGRAGVYVCTVPVRDCWREGEVEPLAQAP